MTARPQAGGRGRGPGRDRPGACSRAISVNLDAVPRSGQHRVAATGLGWWLAIALISTLREKLRTSDIVPGLQGMGITFIPTGLISLAFIAFTGINLDQDFSKEKSKIVAESIEPYSPLIAIPATNFPNFILSQPPF